LREEPVKISAWIPKTLKQLMSEYVTQDTHLNESDFIRDAIREKIQRDAPDMYNRLFKTKPSGASE
jgi:Arc/MetJ-type ribon-helix-helix transcriptional regulator